MDISGRSTSHGFSNVMHKRVIDGSSKMAQDNYGICLRDLL